MGVWLMPYPEVYMPFWVRVWNDDDLGPVVDTLRTLMLDDTIRMVPQVLNTVALRRGVHAAREVVDGRGPDPGRGCWSGWLGASRSGGG